MTPDLSGVFEDFVILYKAVFGRFTWVDAGSRGRTRSEGEGGVNRPIRAAVADGARGRTQQRFDPFMCFWVKL